MTVKCFVILSWQRKVLLIVFFGLGNEPLPLLRKRRGVRRGRRSHCVHFSPGELVYAPLCLGPALLQGFASCELQAGGGLAATFCFLICVYLFSCPRHLPPPQLFIVVVEKIGIIFEPLKK